ncbi:sigma-70 family RNA polymerase sigma factor [Clostridioides difficile]|uniref:RNA polymerase sigma factor n=2 Tax=Clostridioides difficile TaxID=1496 RepID=UPI00093DF5D0|nr:sigma-70 family RNA polymerase sigma factor [Clostridioides difficile]AXU63172.1 ECF subfamily RNA polymerase sigma-24 subunit [Clostridioides difficile]EGT2197875.1 sigma-70 family RNA polymerase sigma factor [Clostridioides difficile]EGT4036355.1 sigma-70 family RNA polymerase sigma factor [Clostridioides difficile]EGT4908574.1 sigma-70 family RNA polymerase sigma factor [Clostridioides difficile]EGT4941935.1 sigma-70 family RNA polymerase sigma factor [Clostridioides difficile]
MYRPNGNKKTVVVATGIHMPKQNISSKAAVLNNNQSRIRYHKAYYSLDRGDGIEHSALFVSLSPDEIYERKLTTEQLHTAIATLPDKQAKRIYAHYFFGMSKTAIAKAEGTSASSVKDAIRRGLCSLEKYLKNNL